MDKAEAADNATDDDDTCLPEALSRRKTLKGSWMKRPNGWRKRLANQRELKQRPYDFRPSPARDKPPRAITTPWPGERIEKLKSDSAKGEYKKRKQGVEPVSGIIKSAISCARFHLRGIDKVKAEWPLSTLAYNCKSMVAMAG